jgi:hypothetical protein
MQVTEADMRDAIDEYGGFLAGYKSWFAGKDADDRPSAIEVIERLQEEYHLQVEVLVIGGDADE